MHKKQTKNYTLPLQGTNTFSKYLIKMSSP